jgi:hypothetical protein
VSKREPPALEPMLSLAEAAKRVYWAATKREDPAEETLNNVVG